MIPNNLALIPHNVHQFAATQAIIDVERKQLRGTQLGQHPYARALFRHLRGGAMRITAKDIRFAAGDYSPKERGGASKSDYIAALDKLIETRGMDCPLPLSGSAVKQYFPDEHYLLSERKNRQWELRFARVDKIEAKQRQQKRRRYQTQVAQAQIELAFTTPSELAAWYKRQERQGFSMTISLNASMPGVNVSAVYVARYFYQDNLCGRCSTICMTNSRAELLLSDGWMNYHFPINLIEDDVLKENNCNF